MKYVIETMDNYQEERFSKVIGKVNKELVKRGLPLAKVTTLEARHNVLFNITSNKYEVEVDDKIWSSDFEVVGKLEKNINSYIYIGDDNVPQFNKESTICQHCDTKRNRNRLFVLKNTKTNEYVNVGSKCCKEYMGVDVEAMLRAIEKCRHILDEFDEFSMSYMKANTTSTLKVAKILVAYYHNISDVDAVTTYQVSKDTLKECIYNLIEGNYNARPLEYEVYKYMESHDDELKAKALTMIDFIKNMDTNNDYIQNLQEIFSNEYMSKKLGGYVAYAYCLYKKELYKRRQANRPKQVSEYVGEVGEKLTIEATLEKTLSFEGMYGITRIHLFRTSDGNILKWSTQKLLDEGKTYTIVGKVKDHVEYRGDKQSVLTRCKCTIK